MNAKVILAVFKRNFVGYFASPLGYLFICLYVVLCVGAAFWTNDFFNQNLANLDTLNFWYPFIMLVFIPAITMNSWADERRQGTDELLLTIPASDLDIVLAKYFAAVAIYTVALLYSLVCNLVVLKTLGRPDIGLFLTTYFGYWFVGLAMLAIGLVASFLTGNLTVAYIFGALFNAPMVLLVFADSALSRDFAPVIKHWSVAEQFRDFGRGVIGFSGMSYFLSIVLAMLYLSMVLIARRHWVRGKDWVVMASHYGVRIVAIVLFAVGVNVLFNRHDIRADATVEKLSSLSPVTRELLESLRNDESKKPILVEAFVSPSVPELYIQTRLNLLSMLQELKAGSNSKVAVRINRTERHNEEAARAEKRYGITPRRLMTQSSGASVEDHVFLSVAISCGLQKVIIPFVDRGTPIEYELVRSIMTVSQQKRKKVGVLQTDAQLLGGGMNPMRMSARGDWPIIEELQKSYEVVAVDASQPIVEKYDVLLAVQPSSLTPEQMTNFVVAVRSGQPTAIFEDPFPAFAGNVPGTSMPRRPPQGNQMMMMMQQQQQAPKGDIRQLWSLLGVNFGADEIVYQAYNPYPKLGSAFPKEFVFIGRGMEGPKNTINDEEPISSKLQQVLFPFPGAVGKVAGSKLEWTALLRTGDHTGFVRFQDLMQMSPMGGPMGLNPDPDRSETGESYVLAARIKGDIPAAQPMADESATDASSLPPGVDMDFLKNAMKGAGAKTPARPEALSKPGKVDVVVVCDIDFLHEEFFRLRDRPEFPEAGIRLEFDNVTLVLNILDELAGDDRFVELRKRRREHRTLERVDALNMGRRKEADKAEQEIRKETTEAKKTEQKNFAAEIQKLKADLEKGASATAVIQQVSIVETQGQRRLEAKAEELTRKRDQQINAIETDLNVTKRQIESEYKLLAVLLPPIPPLLVAGLFFLIRRSMERQGVSRARLRS